MKALKSISCILLLILFSCNKKFKHEIPTGETIPSNCALCDYADQISGQYRGYAFFHSGNFDDSLTLSLEHIFLNLEPQLDSTTMYFRRVWDFDSLSTRIDTVSTQTNTGYFTASMKILGDSLIIHQTMPTPPGPVPIFDFKGKKIP